MTRVQRLAPRHEVALQVLLQGDVVPNLFLLGVLRRWSVEQVPWFGVTRRAHVLGVVLVLPGRLAVPFCPDPGHAETIGRFIRRRYGPCMLIGPRLACDALWEAWAGDARPERWYDQRLYQATRAPGVGEVPGFRRATPEDQPVLEIQSARMEQEDLGIDVWAEEGDAHRQAVRNRIQRGRTWVLERDGRILFHINVGTDVPEGCQVGGTYVPPELRGRGLATLGMRALLDRLLATHPRVTLHVNEANLPAVRVYERAGFARAAPFRLVTLPAR